MKSQIGTWQDVADILNELTGNEYTESAYRKKFQIFDRMFSANQERFSDNNATLASIREEKQELYKETLKMRDERRELNRKLREQARRESFIDLVKRELSNTDPKPLHWTQQNVSVQTSDNDLLIHLTDVHAGIFIDNFWNKYDMDILQQRLQRYLDKILQIKNRHNSENAYIVCGELISGLIHNNLRIENNENVIQQFIKVSNYISDFISVLSEYFKKIHVYLTPGNHSRLSPDKDDSLIGENMDVLLPHFLKAKLQNFPNINIYNNDIEPETAIFAVRHNTVIGIHGDKDRPENVVQNFTLLLGLVPKIVLMGHRHRNALTTVFNTKVIESGCVSGCDSYAISKRLKTAPEQTVTVITEDGIDCIYDIQLDK